MSERKAGWYWARYARTDEDWQCAYYDPDSDAFLFVEWGAISAEAVDEVGQRIPTPDEPWQCVPVKPEDGQIDAGWRSHHPITIYKNMLSSAPKP